MTTLETRLNKLCKTLDNFYDINRGGCCYVAYLIAKELESLKIPYRVGIISNESGKSLEDFSHIPHIFLRTKKAINEGCRGYMPVTFLRNVSSKQIWTYYKTHSWNHTFRKKKLVREAIKRFFAYELYLQNQHIQKCTVA